MNDFKYLRSRKILITGGTGFLGKHLTKKLNELNPKALWSIGSKEVNLLDRGQIETMVSHFKPDIIFHLAAVVGGIGANRKEPGRFFYENLRMGIDLMECARKHQTEKLVVVGTVCAYPKFTQVPFRENDIWNGYPEETNAPYGLAKKMLLVQSKAYREQYGMNSIYLLMANLFGPGDSMDLNNSHVIPSLIHKFYLAKRNRDAQVELWGSGNATREFLYVEDAVNGLLLSGENYNSSDPLNIGTGQEISIRKTAEIIAELMQYTGSIIWDTTMPDGQPRRCLDITRAKEKLHFEASTSFAKGLEKTIAEIAHRLESSHKQSIKAESKLNKLEIFSH